LRRCLAHLLLTILIGIPAISNGAGPSFPSENYEIRDPSGHYAATWKRGGLAEDKPHRLFVKDLSSGRVSRLLDFYRQVDVLWAPDGRFLAVTDWTGSNVSQVLLFQPGKKKVINLADVLYRSLGKQPEISNCDHTYFEAIRWEGPKKLVFKVFGDGAADMKRFEFERNFVFDVSGVVREVKPDQTGKYEDVVDR
jgi:hypothetical protein